MCELRNRRRATCRYRNRPGLKDMETRILTLEHIRKYSHSLLAARIGVMGGWSPQSLPFLG